MCERRLFIWLQSDDVINTCVNKVNTVIGSGTKTEVTLVEGVIGMTEANSDESEVTSPRRQEERGCVPDPL